MGKRGEVWQKPVGIDTMGFSVQLWLSRKGIETETLAKVQQLARGSLAGELLMILGSLDRRLCRRKEGHEDVPERGVKKTRRDYSSFDPVALKEVRKIVDSAQRERTKRITKLSTTCC